MFLRVRRPPSCSPDSCTLTRALDEALAERAANGQDDAGTLHVPQAGDDRARQEAGHVYRPLPAVQRLLLEQDAPAARVRALPAAQPPRAAPTDARLPNHARSRRCLDAEIPVGLGSDIAGGYTVDLQVQMRQAVIASRLLESASLSPTAASGNALRVSWKEALFLATRGGALALAEPNVGGRFCVGEFFDAQLRASALLPLMPVSWPVFEDGRLTLRLPGFARPQSSWQAQTAPAEAPSTSSIATRTSVRPRRAQSGGQRPSSSGGPSATAATARACGSRAGVCSRCACNDGPKDREWGRKGHQRGPEVVVEVQQRERERGEGRMGGPGQVGGRSGREPRAEDQSARGDAVSFCEEAGGCAGSALGMARRERGRCDESSSRPQWARPSAWRTLGHELPDGHPPRCCPAR